MYVLTVSFFLGTRSVWNSEKKFSLWTSLSLKAGSSLKLTILTPVLSLMFKS